MVRTSRVFFSCEEVDNTHMQFSSFGEEADETALQGFILDPFVLLLLLLFIVCDCYCLII